MKTIKDAGRRDALAAAADVATERAHLAAVIQPVPAQLAAALAQDSHRDPQLRDHERQQRAEPVGVDCAGRGLLYRQGSRAARNDRLREEGAGVPHLHGDHGPALQDLAV